jgi:hypothetical protein
MSIIFFSLFVTKYKNGICAFIFSKLSIFLIKKFPEQFSIVGIFLFVTI